MLVQFSFGNFKCFRRETTLNFVASRTKGYEYYSHQTPFKYSLLRSLVVLGPNASGKTKLFDAIKFMCDVVCPPNRYKNIPAYDYWQSTYDSFRLNTQASKDDSFFEAVFILDNIQYRYGFNLNKSKILSEWLYAKASREALVFCRDSDGITIKGKYINEKVFDTIKSAKMIADPVLLLSVLGTFNDPLSLKIVNFFKSITVLSANDLKPISVLNQDDAKKSIVSFLRSFDINIEDINLHEMEEDEIPDKIKALLKSSKSGRLYDGINTTHKVYNDLYEYSDTTTFSLENDESFGTNRLLSLSWPIIKSLREGSILFIDEIDSGIHTNIVKAIIMLFYMTKSKAQLICNTQNTSLLNSEIPDNGKKLFRKDQIYLVNKNRYGESELLPVTTFKNDLRSNLENIYLNGELTGVPYVQLVNLLNLIENSCNE